MKPTALEFIDYFQSFYGPNGAIPMQSTREEALEATLIYVTSSLCAEFCGDSVDRENVRDVLLARRNQGYKKLQQALVDMMTGNRAHLTMG
jgi:hypothetical protein